MIFTIFKLLNSLSFLFELFGIIVEMDILTYNSPLRFNVIVKLLAPSQWIELGILGPQPEIR